MGSMANSRIVYILFFIDCFDEEDYLCVEQWSLQIWEGKEQGDESWEKLVAQAFEEVLRLANRVLPGSCFEKNR